MPEEIGINDIASLMVDLRGMARYLLQGEGKAISVRPTALVISAIRRSKRSDQQWEDLTWENREQFFAIMFREMKHALCDHARKRNALKRPKIDYLEPGDFDLYALPKVAENQPEVIIALDEALSWLEARNRDLVDIVNHHYFTGLTVLEIGRLLKLSEKTVKRRLAEARLLLHKKILDLVQT